MTDKTREVIADLFDRTADLARARVGDFPTDVSAALTIGSGLAKVVATLVRAVGVADAKKAVEDLVAHRNDGVITDDNVIADNAKISDAVASMYARGTPTAAPIADESTFDDVVVAPDADTAEDGGDTGKT